MDFGNSTIIIANQPVNTNQTEENTVNTGEKPVTIAIFVCLGLIGCLGNGFVLLIFCSSEKLRQSIVNIYLINQSAIDLMASLTLIVTAKGVTKSGDWSADRIQGKLHYFQLSATRFISTNISVRSILIKSCAIQFVGCAVLKFYNLYHSTSIYPQVGLNAMY